MTTPTIIQAHEQLVQELRLIGRDDLANECIKRGPEGTAKILTDGMLCINELTITVEQAVKTWKQKV